MNKKEKLYKITDEQAKYIERYLEREKLEEEYYIHSKKSVLTMEDIVLLKRSDIDMYDKTNKREPYHNEVWAIDIEKLKEFWIIKLKEYDNNRANTTE